MSSGLLSGKVAVVTGAARGIGFEIARQLTAHGAAVVLADLDERDCAAAAQSISPSSIGLACNVTDPVDVDNLGRKAHEQFGSLDIWVNNAGITRDASLRRMTLEDFRAVVDVHLSGTWLGVRSASAIMREQQAGSIINISSLSGKSGNAGQTNYSAAKAGVVGLTKAAAKELAHLNVRVNAVMPGLTRTAMTEAMDPEVFAAREADVPMKRAASPTEIANCVVFLASELSSYVTGAVLEVGGGRYM